MTALTLLDFAFSHYRKFCGSGEYRTELNSSGATVGTLSDRSGC